MANSTFLRPAIYLVILLAASCKARNEIPTAEVLGQVQELTTEAPLPAYHVGAYGDLAGYGERNASFSDQEWRSIGSTQNQAPYRRGLYVSQHPAYNEIYGLDSLRSGQGPWILSVFIKPECRSGARLRQSVYAVDNDMQDYFGKRPEWSNDVSRFQNLCLNEQVIGRAGSRTFLTPKNTALSTITGGPVLDFGTFAIRAA
jgi:hypothetical protein